MITYEVKDVTTVTDGIIAHGVNCQRAMGSGVALALLRKWPEVREHYMQVEAGADNLGNVQYVDVGDNLKVANCWTQEHYGPGDRRYASPEAIMEALFNVYTTADQLNCDVAMPQIGCGLAGLSWSDEVEPIINVLDHDFPNVNTLICLWG